MLCCEWWCSFSFQLHPCSLSWYVWVPVIMNKILSAELNLPKTVVRLRQRWGEQRLQTPGRLSSDTITGKESPELRRTQLRSRVLLPGPGPVWNHPGGDGRKKWCDLISKGGMDVSSWIIIQGIIYIRHWGEFKESCWNIWIKNVIVILIFQNTEQDKKISYYFLHLIKLYSFNCRFIEI